MDNHNRKREGTAKMDQINWKALPWQWRIKTCNAKSMEGPVGLKPEVRWTLTKKKNKAAGPDRDCNIWIWGFW